MVTDPLPLTANSGRKCASVSFSLICPNSIMRITLGVVAITLVSDARSKIVSMVIASGFGASARWPKAF